MIKRKVKFKRKTKKDFDLKWVIKITALAFFITLIFYGTSELILKQVNIFLGILVILIFILLGALFDMIGIATASASEIPFHSMASQKVKGAKTALKLIKEAEKVSALCNDVIGDICNIISGGAGILIATNIAYYYKMDSILVTLIITSIIAAGTIGCKALGKILAVNESEGIVYKTASVVKYFIK